MAGALAILPSQPSFRDPQAPVEVSRGTNSANLVIEPIDHARLGSIVVHSDGSLRCADSLLEDTILWLREVPEDWIPAESISDSEFEFRQELSSYARLEENWDGDGAKTPSQAAINDALTFLKQRPSDIPLPYPEEGKEGDVGVYWDNPNAKIFTEINFEGNGTFSYFSVHGSLGSIIEKCGQDNLDVSEEWPEDLLQMLRKLGSE